MTADLGTAKATERPAAPAKAWSYDRRLAIIIAGSLALHALVIVLVLVTDGHKPFPESQEIPVELVLEPPKPPSPPGGAAGEPSKPDSKPASNQSAAKAEAPSKPEDKPQTKPEEKPPEKTAEKPPEKQPEKPPLKPSESQAEKPAAQPPDKPAEKPAAKPAETAAQKAAERRAEKQAEQAAAAQSAREERAARAAEQQQHRLQQQQQQSQQRAAGAAPDKRAEAQAAAAFMQHGFMPRSFQAVALPSSAANGEDVMDYEVLVLGLLAREKRYPETAVARHAQGAAAVGFTIDDNGAVLTVSLLQSSGQADLDAETLALVRRAAPFPKPPAGYKHYFAATVRFGLEQME